MERLNPVYWHGPIPRQDTCVNCGANIYLALDCRWYHKWTAIDSCSWLLESWEDKAEPYQW